MSLILAAILFMSAICLPTHVPPSPPLLLVGCLVYGFTWGAHHASQRILLWRSLRSRLPATEALLQASQALPLLLLLFLSSVTPRATAYLSTASLAISPLILLLLPRKCKRRGEKAATTRERKREAGDLGEMDEEERAAENVSEKQALWHGDLQGITSCNKV